MRSYQQFTPFVVDLRSALENRLGYHSRVFVQRRFE
jgi:hypothetical protein